MLVLISLTCPMLGGAQGALHNPSLAGTRGGYQAPSVPPQSSQKGSQPRPQQKAYIEESSLETRLKEDLEVERCMQISMLQKEEFWA